MRSHVILHNSIGEGLSLTRIAWCTNDGQIASNDAGDWNGVPVAHSVSSADR